MRELIYLILIFYDILIWVYILNSIRMRILRSFRLRIDIRTWRLYFIDIFSSKFTFKLIIWIFWYIPRKNIFLQKVIAILNIIIGLIFLWLSTRLLVSLNKLLMNLVILLANFLFKMIKFLLEIFDRLDVVFLHPIRFFFPFLFIINLTLYYMLKIFHLIW